MGLFDKIFGSAGGSDKDSQQLPWIPLTEQEQLEKLQTRSYERPQIIFKHSTSCGISSMVLSMFTRSYPLEEETVDLYFLDIHRSRQISNEIASQYGIRHESPQLIILQNGGVLTDTSHGAIADMDLLAYVPKKTPE